MGSWAFDLGFSAGAVGGMGASGANPTRPARVLRGSAAPRAVGRVGRAGVGTARGTGALGPLPPPRVGRRRVVVVMGPPHPVSRADSAADAPRIPEGTKRLREPTHHC